MIQALFFGAFDYIAKNRWAQIAVGLGVFYLFWRTNEEIAERRGAKRQQRRAAKARERERVEAIQEIQEIKEEASNEADQAIDAGRAAARDGILSDDTIARTLGRPRSSA